MKKLNAAVFCVLAVGGISRTALAMELDWSGQFRSEFNWLQDYTLDNAAGGNPDPTRANPAIQGGPATPGGYYITPAGSNNATFETLFLKLQPKLVVNDNIYIKTELWLGDPTFGFFGASQPFSADQRLYYSTFSRGSVVTAQRFWAEFLTDFGTIQVGRIPLNYGLGVVWNSGDGIWDHYESTGDAIRLVSKFGAFTFSPAAITYSIGNTVGGACDYNGLGGSVMGGPGTSFCTPASGAGGVSDYSLLIKYENPDEDFDAGLNFIRRIGGAAQDPIYGYLGPSGVVPGTVPSTANVTGQLTPTGFAYNTWDIYLKKRLFGKLTLAAELPIVTGSLGGLTYNTWALALEGDYKMTDTWEFGVKAGHAPGQANIQAGTAPGSYTAFYFHPDYHLGMIMFNYNLRNIGQLNTLNAASATAGQMSSPYDNPIEDAEYAALTGTLHADKWTFDADAVYAVASGQDYCQAGYMCFNNWDRQYMGTQAQSTQGTQLGFETDLGAAFQYDEYFQFRLDLGIFFPGNFYAFSNVAGVNNGTSPMWGGVARAGVTF